MTKQTKQLLAIGAGLVVLYLLLKPKKVTTASSAEDKMKLANQPADDAQLRKECKREVAINARPTVVQSDEKWAIYNENQIAACMERKKTASIAGVDVDSQLFQKFDVGEKFHKKNYVDTSSNSFFQTISTRDPRDIKV